MPFVAYKATGVGKIVTTIVDVDGVEGNIYVWTSATPTLPEGAPQPVADISDNPMDFLTSRQKTALYTVAKAIRDHAVETIVP